MLSDQPHRRGFMTLLAGAAASPFSARAEQAMPVVGFLRQGGKEPPVLTNAFRQGLSEAGLIEGRDVIFENRWADGHYDQLPALAAELVDHRVAVIAAAFLPAALAAKSATQSIPIVFLSGSDPIGSGLVSSMNRPTGNVTGIATMFTLLGTKILELLHDLVPKATLIGVLTNPSNPNAAHQLQDLQSAARTVGKELVILDASNPQEIDSAFEMAAQRKIGALIVTADGFFFGRQDQIVALASRYAIATIYTLSQFVRAGGLMSYGANLPDAYRQTGIYVGRILKGAAPADLPVLQPTKVELVINLKTAKSLGLEVPDKLIALADEVIE